MKKLIFKILLTIILYNLVNGSDKESCTIENSNLPGTCQYLNNGQPNLKEVILILGGRNYTLYPKQIGTGKPICCPNQNNSKTDEMIAINRNNSKNNDNKSNVTRIFKKKCNEYAEFVYENKTMSNLNDDGSVSEKIERRRNCYAQGLIIGGSPARAGEFPHMALIGSILPNKKFDWICGGSLISEKYILTAAYCTFPRNFKGRQPIVRLGVLTVNNIKKGDDDPEDFNITEIIPYPNFTRPSKYDDIALIKLDRTVKFNQYKRPACLSRERNSNIASVIATGWGATEWRNSKSSTLLKVILDKFNYSSCNDFVKNASKSFLKDGIRDNTQICYGSKYERKDTCKGDLGGPIQIIHELHQCMYEIVGITSFGIRGCGVPDIPAVYTRIYPYIEWFEQIIWG